MLCEVVELVAGVGALVAGLRVVKPKHVVAKFFHEMPTDMITICALGKGHVTDGTLAADVDSLGLVDIRFTFFFDQSLVSLKETRNVLAMQYGEEDLKLD